MNVMNNGADFNPNASNVVDLAAFQAVNSAPSAPAPPTTEAGWFEFIAPDFVQSNVNLIAGAKKLIEAKKALRKSKGSFCRLVERLGIDLGKAERLMKIARHPVLGDSAHAPILPLSWMTLYTLCPLSPQKLLQFIADAIVHPRLERREAELLVRRQRQSNLGPQSKTQHTDHRNDGRISDRNDAYDGCHRDERHAGDHTQQHDRGNKHEIDNPVVSAQPVAAFARDDIGPTSRGEVERLRARAEELEREVRVRDVRIRALEAEVENLRAAANLSGVQIGHQRRQFHKALRAAIEAEQPDLVKSEREQKRLRSSALTDLIELAQSLARDGLKADRLDLIYRPELAS